MYKGMCMGGKIVSGFKPGSSLLEQYRGQPMSLGSHWRCIMSSDGQVHPWKFYVIWITCS